MAKISQTPPAFRKTIQETLFFEELRQRAADVDAGSVTISGTDTSAVVTFATPRNNTDYAVVASASDFTGAPAAAPRIVARITKTKTGFTILNAGAPGAGNSVTFDWMAASNG